ncbi:MAG TPA: PA-phosphatase [Microscillaceae bacterium]|jgi:membrane-associated phospholipid phosphatase|nr:PA-phosphatase [Microscillaceae bacterium]
MLNSFRAQPYFFALFGAYVLLGAGLLRQFPKGTLELWWNQRHQPWLDATMPYLTHLGDGIFFSLVILLLLFVSYYKALVAALSFGLTGLIVQALKRTVFADVPRPKAFFGEQADLHFALSKDLVHCCHSFPSGHSTSAFAVFFLLAYFSRQQPAWGLLWFALALVASLSRIYLLQHFFVDTYFGALLGVGLTWLVVYYAEQSPRLGKNPVLQRRLRLGK